MKTVIMAGGLGKRIAELDSSVPKPLISISGKPILQWEIECLVSQGFTDIILTISHMAEKIQEFFGDGSNFGCKIEYYVEKQSLGNAGALFKLWEERKLEENFLLLNADSMFDVDFKRFVDFHEAKCNALATLFTHPNNHPYDSTLIVADGDNVIQQWLTKEDQRPKFYKNCVNAGLHIINTELLALSGLDPATIDSTHKVDLDRDVLKPLVSTERIYSYNSPEYVKDMGTPERFQQVCEDLESGKVQARNLATPQKAIFLDRDGTINRSVGFLTDINDFELLIGVPQAIKNINASEYLCIVVTNQPVIARGEVTVEELQEIHNKMETLLGEQGAYIDGLYYCPHHPDKGFEGEVAELKINCDCRKPKSGMLLQAAKDFNIDLNSSWMIGDSLRDIEAGKNAGCKASLIGTQAQSYGQNNTVHFLFKAVDLILKKYTVQNALKVLNSRPTHQVSEDDFFKARYAYNNCLTLIWAEEKFKILSQNYYEWEKEIKDGYDFFLKRQNSDPNCNQEMQQFGLEEIIVLNRRLSNFLSSVRLYQDQIRKNLSLLDDRGVLDNEADNEVSDKKKKLLDAFNTKSSALYDSSLAYQIMEFLRNYMQHQGLIITKLTAVIPFCRKISIELPYFVEADLKEIRSVEKFDQKIKSKQDLANQSRWLNLIGLVREYYFLLVGLHGELRKITTLIPTKTIKDVSDVLEKYYGSLDFPQYAFESSEEKESFLLQLAYLGKINTLRNVNYQPEQREENYIDKKVFQDSSKVKWNNAVRQEIIYNQE